MKIRHGVIYGIESSPVKTKLTSFSTIRRKFDFLMKFEDVLAIFLGIIFGCFLGFTKFDLPLGEAYKVR